MHQNMYVISYDIENTPLRTRIAKMLHHWGLHRVQYSVFLGTIEREKMPTLWNELAVLSTHKAWSAADSILLIPVHAGQVKAIKVLGSWPDRWDEITGEKNTLMV